MSCTFLHYYEKRLQKPHKILQPLRYLFNLTTRLFLRVFRDIKHSLKQWEDMVPKAI